MLLSINDLRFGYEGVSIFDGASLFLEKGRVASVLGASGIGKTTLFKLITGLLPLDSGSIDVEGEGHFCDNISYMRQEAVLLPWRTVWQNIFLFTELGKCNRENQERYVHLARVLIEKLGLQDVCHRFPDELSGGMKQRVALVSVILKRKPLLLLDEPFSFLDVLIKEKLYDFLDKEVKSSDNSILLITHDFRDALTLSDDIFVICQRKINKVASDCKNLSKFERGELIENIRSHMNNSFY